MTYFVLEFSRARNRQLFYWLLPRPPGARRAPGAMAANPTGLLAAPLRLPCGVVLPNRIAKAITIITMMIIIMHIYRTYTMIQAQLIPYV